MRRSPWSPPRCGHRLGLALSFDPRPVIALRHVQPRSQQAGAARPPVAATQVGTGISLHATRRAPDVACRVAPARRVPALRARGARSGPRNRPPTPADSRILERARTQVERRCSLVGDGPRLGPDAAFDRREIRSGRIRSSKDRCKDRSLRRATLHRPLCRAERRSGRPRRRVPASLREPRRGSPSGEPIAIGTQSATRITAHVLSSVASTASPSQSSPPASHCSIPRPMLDHAARRALGEPRRSWRPPGPQEAGACPASYYPTLVTVGGCRSIEP